MSNKLALGTFAHDPYIGNSANASYLVKDFKDVFDFNAGSNAKLDNDSIRLLPKSNLSNVFNGALQDLDFDTDGNEKLGSYDQIVMRIDIQNTGANTAQLVGAQYFLDKVDINLGGSEFEKIYNHQIALEDIFIQDSDEKVQNFRQLRGYTGGIDGTPYGSQPDLLAGARRTIYINLPCAFTKCNIFMPQVSSTITFRFSFRGSALRSTSLATTISLQRCELYCRGPCYNSTIRNALLARYKSVDHVMPYYVCKRAVLANVTLSDTTKVQIANTQLGGMHSAAMFFLVVPQGAQAENLYNFTDVELLDVLRNGSTISSYNDQETTWIRQQCADVFKTTAISSNNIYPIIQSVNPYESIAYGVQRGSLVLTNNDTIEIRVGTGLSGAYDIYVYAYVFSNITLTKTGQLILTQIAN